MNMTHDKVTIEEVIEIYYTVYVGDVEYRRYAPNSWFRYYGDSLEPVYSEESELEHIFEKYKKD